MSSLMHAVLAAVCSVASIASPAAWGRRITLNDTGMIHCTDRQGEWTSECAKSRQDAADGRDVNDPNPDDGLAGFSFRKVCRSGQVAGEGSCPVDPPLGSGPDNWGCTQDNVSQLTWEMKTDDGGMHDGLRSYTNKGGKARNDPSDAAWLVDATNAEALCGATNWRLPDPLELQAIVDYGQGAPGTSGPWIDPSFFPNSYGMPAWTRIESFNDSKWAWYVRFSFGQIALQHRFENATARLVRRAARSATALSHAALAKDRFIPSPDGTEVTDTLTGLVWRRCAAGLIWNNDTQSCDGTATEFLWKEALDYAKVNGQGGWRIPNVKELFSIVDLERAGTNIDPLAFPNTPAKTFLSSTTLDKGDLYVQVVVFGSGFVSQQVSDRFSDWSLRLVRRGRE